ncbi:SusC/RagA family TonB-linked outer membrane protein [Sinomicrobium sp. M5D2P9]
MKVKPIAGFFHCGKIFLHYIMKTFVFLFFTALFGFSPGNMLSQNARIVVDTDKTVTIDEVFDLIRQQTEYKFIYHEDLFKNSSKILLKKGTVTANELLKLSLSVRDFDFTFTGNNVVIIRKKPDDSAFAQLSVKGTVTDERGDPLPGVTIILKNTETGAISDFDGNYEISVPDGDGILVFSYMGFTTREIEVDGKAQVDVVLREDVSKLEEVVVIGYGAVKKEDLTGAVGSLGGEEIAATSIPDAAGALQGRVAGVNVEKNVGKPGSGFSINIRGLGSIPTSNNSNPNSPLYVVDGIPTGSGLADLNPNDIEKIDILKDASATAIYGSRGANGVVIVTTKKGRKGKFTIQYDGYVGIRTPSNLPEMMNGEEYVRWRTDLFTNQGKNTDRSNPDFFTQEEWGRIDSGNYTNWRDLILRDGLQTSNTVTISGGDDKGTFALSLGQLKEEGTVPGEDFNRYNLRLNLNRQFGEKWQAGGNLYFTHSIQNQGSYETLRSAYRLPPVAYPYDENGDPQFFAYRNDFVTNPLFEYKDDGEIRENRRYRAFGNVFLQVEPIEGLTLRSQFSPHMIYKRDGYYGGQWWKGGAGKIENTNASYNTEDYFSYVLDNQLSYQKTIDRHNLNATFIQSIQYEQWESANQAARNFPFNSKWYNLDAVPRENIVRSETNYQQRSLASFLGRLQYTYNDKYLFTLTGRYDGSSRLAPDNKWAFFPSGAFAWKISDEDFLKSADKLSNLKLRLSYGVSGNDAVAIYGTQSNVSQRYYDFDGVVSPAYYKNRLANYALGWEKTTEFNIGLDYGFLDYRINGAIDVYRRDSKDLIMERQLPQTSGWQNIWDNVGWVRNTGLEISLNTLNIRTEDFSWSTDIVFDSNRNEIVELYGEKNDDIGNAWFIGKPIQVNYDYEFDGIWQQDEADLAAGYGQTPGQVRVRDLNGDGVIDAEDRKIIGQRTPKWSGSITNTLKYKNWDFSVYVYTRQGQQLFNTFRSTFMTLEGNYTNAAVDYWTPSNPSDKYHQPGNAGRFVNSFRYQDISFVRVGNISLGYSLPEKALSKLNLNKLRVYFTATNPFVFTSFEGFDPEWASQNTWGMATGFSSYLLGVNLEL